jgi:hypothetical protein
MDCAGNGIAPTHRSRFRARRSLITYLAHICLESSRADQMQILRIPSPSTLGNLKGGNLKGSGVFVDIRRRNPFSRPDAPRSSSAAGRTPQRGKTRNPNIEIRNQTVASGQLPVASGQLPVKAEGSCRLPVSEFRRDACNWKLTTGNSLFVPDTPRRRGDAAETLNRR